MQNFLLSYKVCWWQCKLKPSLIVTRYCHSFGQQENLNRRKSGRNQDRTSSLAYYFLAFIQTSMTISKYWTCIFILCASYFYSLCLSLILRIIGLFNSCVYWNWGNNNMKTNTASLLKLGLKAKFCLIIRCENSVFLSYDFSSSSVSEINSEIQAYAQRGSRLKGQYGFHWKS